MCKTVKCGTCSKWSWHGDGKHVKEIFAKIEPKDRCLCGYTTTELKAAIDDHHVDDVYPKNATYWTRFMDLVHLSE